MSADHTVGAIKFTDKISAPEQAPQDISQPGFGISALIYQLASVPIFAVLTPIKVTSSLGTGISHGLQDIQ
jgi:hypothetical protein